MSKQRVLAVVAHPDDESLFMGGTLARHAKRGEHVCIVVMADGESSRVGGGNPRERSKQFGAAMRALGITKWGFADAFEDQKSDRVPQVMINQVVDAWVQDERPTMVYTHYLGDLNLDHRRTAEAVMVATRGICAVAQCAPEWPSRTLLGKFPYTHWVDIQHTLEAKLKACACYKDELREYPHPRSLKALGEKTREEFIRVE